MAPFWTQAVKATGFPEEEADSAMLRNNKAESRSQRIAMGRLFGRAS
jgi:hypothetical protein